MCVCVCAHACVCVCVFMYVFFVCVCVCACVCLFVAVAEPGSVVVCAELTWTAGLMWKAAFFHWEGKLWLN